MRLTIFFLMITTNKNHIGAEAVKIASHFKLNENCVLVKITFYDFDFFSLMSPYYRH